jgi:hypothetical protein
MELYLGNYQRDAQILLYVFIYIYIKNITM